MNKRIFIITDYKGLFGSKWGAIPYRSGFDLSIFKNEFTICGYKTIILNFSQAANNKEIEVGDYVIYTSTEDINYRYKDFISDVIFYLEKKGAKIIPKYEYLKATNNKVSMELLKKIILNDEKIIKSNVYGAFEEFDKEIPIDPLVFKKPQGAMSRGVFLAMNKHENNKLSKFISRSRSIIDEVKDLVRHSKHIGYIKESIYRNKFITQSFIPNLEHDFKILIFGEKYFIFSRPVKENDFRASGSGYQKYLFGSKCKYPSKIFDYAKLIFNKMNTPNLSLDIAYDGKDFHLLEFQGIYFGTVGVIKSDVYFKNINDNWISFNNDSTIESIYADSIINYIKKLE